nr:site-specific DNA-methyltransferase [Qipengyuania flava]
MASLAEREGLKGQVQCIYIDPPYGIKFNSNFQWSTTSRDVKDGKADHLTREPEQVKAFRDTWADGIHSYLTYLRDRLTVARDLLTESGSVFVQISDENVHRVRALMDEVFGDENFVSQIGFAKTSGLESVFRMPATFDYLLWFSRDVGKLKYRPIWLMKEDLAKSGYTHCLVDGEERTISSCDEDEIQRGKIYTRSDLTKPGPGSKYDLEFQNQSYTSGKRWWGTTPDSMERLGKADRISAVGKNLRFRRFLQDSPTTSLKNFWDDTGIAGFASDKNYVVETNASVVQRCILMTTDPGDLVLDPTCGSGTTAYVSEQWGRRWITIDTSRVALALARARIMGARYPWYLLADSREGQVKEGEITRTPPRDTPTQGRIRQGFVYKRVPHITLKSIANNAEIDTIWEEYQEKLEPLRAEINAQRGRDGSDPDLPPFEEWTMPREPGAPWPDDATKALAKARGLGSDAVRTKWLGKLNEVMERDYTLDTLPEHPVDPWSDPECEKLHAEWWKLRIERQQEIDASIAAKADTEYLYDQPYEDKSRVRVAGPFTVESLSPHRVPAVDVDDSLFDEIEAAEGRAKKGESGERADFAEMVLENLKRSGVQQRAKDDKLVFESMKLWPGEWIVAEGTVRQKSLTEAEDEEETEAGPTRRAAIFVGPEYGTITRPQVVAAAREAQENGFDILIAAAFNFDAHAGEVTKMGPLTVLQARINPDLHMPDLANTGAGNLFTVFGEPDIQVHDEGDGMVSIEVMGVDMYKGGQIESGDADDIAVWFIDTDYNYESFFVRHAYFPGANDPYKALKTTLKAEVDQQAWDSLNRVRSRPFAKPKDGRVAVKVVNHLGDEVMKVLEV